MNKTTNILLVTVIVLLVALLFGNNSQNKVFAQGAASSDPIIFTVDSENKEVYLVNVEKSIILHYKTSSGLKLKAARKFDYDVQLMNEFYKGSGESYLNIVKRVRLENKKKK